MNEKDPLNYEYVGGGWFRLWGVPKGQPAPMLHGEKFLELVAEALGASVRG